MITIAVDAMGGDHAPRPEVEGSVLAAREFDVRILLVGQPNVVRAELAKHAAPNLPVEIVPASEVITDRKSTRLNSSHLVISYAVFCLKKKKRYDTSSLRFTPIHLHTYANTIFYPSHPQFVCLAARPPM